MRISHSAALAIAWTAFPLGIATIVVSLTLFDGWKSLAMLAVGALALGIGWPIVKATFIKR